MSETYEDKVERLAKKLFHGGTGNEAVEGDMEAARRAARRLLEDSEARTSDPALYDPEDDDVIRRSSSETASTGETGGTRWSHEGE